MNAHTAIPFGTVSLVSGPLPMALIAITAVLLLLVLIVRPRLRWIGIAAAASGLGALVGLFLCWLLSDRLNLFEVDLSPVSRAWIATGFAGAFVFLTALVRGRWLRRVVAVLGVILALLVGALGVNADFGQYTTIGSLEGQAAAGVLPDRILALQKTNAPGGDLPSAGAAVNLRNSAPAGDQPQHGIVGTVRIPATVSHFKARAGYVYLPPRALVADPPRLPVLILLAGQPGGPDIMVRAGRVEQIANDYAAAHHGLAPIIVIPDQLSAPQVNPMCVDSPIGNSATYLTVDVPHWILTHLSVQPRVGAWAIGGFSQGGTCTIQLGAGHPDIWSGLLDISGQVAPFTGSIAQTIAKGFGGSVAAYHAALPFTLLKEHAPYHDTVGVFTSGQLDAKYGPGATEVADAARAAGMKVTRLISPGTAHDWSTVRWSLEHGLPIIAAHQGLQRTP